MPDYNIIINDTAHPVPVSDATLNTLLTGRLPVLVSGRIPVDGSGVTQPVSGTFWQATQPVSLATLPSLVAGSAVIGHVLTDSGSVAAVTNAGTFAVQDTQVLADNAGFTDGTTKVQPAGFILDETAGTALTENDAGAARMDSKRAQVLVIEDATTRGRRATVNTLGAQVVDFTDDYVATATLTATGQDVTLSPVNNIASIAVQLTGTWTGGITLQGTLDGANWSAIPAILVPGGITPYLLLSNTGIWKATGGPYYGVRLYATAIASGAVTVTLRLSRVPAGVVLTDSVPAGTNTIGAVNQGTAGSGAWPVLATGTTGAAASGTAKSGNPVQVGAVYNSTPPSVTTGQVVELQSTAKGSLIVGVGTEGFTTGQGTPAGQTTANGWPVALLAAPNIANNQVAMSTSAATILSARATRKQATIVNMSTSITVYIGIATVTSGNGFPLLPGQSIDIFGTLLVQGIAASGTPSVAYIDQYY